MDGLQQDMKQNKIHSEKTTDRERAGSKWFKTTTLGNDEKETICKEWKTTAESSNVVEKEVMKSLASEQRVQCTIK